MKISKEKLLQEAAMTGFKMEHLEKVHMLMDLLADFASFPQLGLALPQRIRANGEFRNRFKFYVSYPSLAY